MSTSTVSPSAISISQYSALQTTLPTQYELFNFQVSALRSKGFDLPSDDVVRLREHLPGHQGLFIVIPRKPSILDLDDLASLIELKGRRGVNVLDQKQVVDTFNVPTTAHLLLDVDDGRKRLNKKASDSLQEIKDERRAPYSAWHGIVHAILFPCVLSTHSLCLVGSKYNDDSVPILNRDTQGFLRLTFSYYTTSHKTMGTPSAGKIVGYTY